ncbi:MAG: transcription elongation factor GreA [Coriobacteriia bacterium]|nr:transcription elongation factor GreA [Coriobacteriia bacterium]
MTQDFILTAEGKKKLEDELSNLVNVVRGEVIERIKEAKSFGDLSENSEYDEAKKAQGMSEGRIQEITQILENASIVEVPKRITRVSVGTEAVIEDVDGKATITVKIVGTAECNPADMEISNESPIGSALIGLKKDEIAEVDTPAGHKSYKVVSIKAIKR